MANVTRMKADVPFTCPAVGELYVNTATDRVCVVEGWEGHHGLIDRHRRVKVRYLDNGRRTKVHLYRWDTRRPVANSYPRMLRVHPDIRIRRLKVTLNEYRILHC